MKNRNDYKIWGLAAVIFVAIILTAFFTFSKYQKTDENIGNPITQTPKQQKLENPTDAQGQDNINSSDEEEKNTLELKQLTLFTGDIDTYSKKEAETIVIAENLSVEKKLEVIAEELSKMHFDNLPIEVKQVEQIDGKEIAIINLKEYQKPSDKNKTWMQYLNAGSAGSRITLITLEESFLQRDLKGEWIAGIKILYEGQNIEEMDHFPGTEIIFRQD